MWTGDGQRGGSLRRRRVIEVTGGVAYKAVDTEPYCDTYPFDAVNVT
jgi:hypothetical protein